MQAFIGGCEFLFKRGSEGVLVEHKCYFQGENIGGHFN